MYLEWVWIISNNWDLFSGINFSVQSYSDLTNTIFKIIIDNFYNLEFKEKTFLQIYELTTKQLNEYETLPPYKKFYAYFEKMIKPNITLNSELLPVNNFIIRSLTLLAFMILNKQFQV